MPSSGGAADGTAEYEVVTLEDSDDSDSWASASSGGGSQRSESPSMHGTLLSPQHSTPVPPPPPPAAAKTPPSWQAARPVVPPLHMTHLSPLPQPAEQPNGKQEAQLSMSPHSEEFRSPTAGGSIELSAYSTAAAAPGFGRQPSASSPEIQAAPYQDVEAQSPTDPAPSDELPPAQTRRKSERRVRWAASVVSPRPRERHRRRSRSRPTGGSNDDPHQDEAFPSSRLRCPPDDGEAEGFAAARLARTGATAASIWAQKAGWLVAALLLAALSPGGSQFSSGRSGGAGRKPEELGFGLASALAALTALLVVFSDSWLRTAVARRSKAAATRQALLLHGSLGCLAAAALAAACWLQPSHHGRSHPHVNADGSSILPAVTGSSLNAGGTLLASASIVAAALSAVGAEALRLGVERDWLWELLGSDAHLWPREADVRHGLMACELGGWATGGLVLLFAGPPAAAAAVGVLHAAALGLGMLLLSRHRSLGTLADSAAQAADGTAASTQLHDSASDDQLRSLEEAQSSGSGSHDFSASSDYSVERQPAALYAGRPADPGAAASWRQKTAEVRAAAAAWADHPAAPAAAASALLQASVLDLGIVLLASLAARGVAPALVAAAAAAAVLAASIGSSCAPALSIKSGGLLPCGTYAAAANTAALWLAIAPLLAEVSGLSPWRPAVHCVLVAALVAAAAARATFQTVVTELVECWHDNGDAGSVAQVQRWFAGGCHALMLLIAVPLASTEQLPWLMIASAVVATGAAVVYALFAAVEWRYAQHSYLGDGGTDAAVVPGSGVDEDEEDSLIGS